MSYQRTFRQNMVSFPSFPAFDEFQGRLKDSSLHLSLFTGLLPDVQTHFPRFDRCAGISPHPSSLPTPFWYVCVIASSQIRFNSTFVVSFWNVSILKYQLVCLGVALFFHPIVPQRWVLLFSPGRMSFPKPNRLPYRTEDLSIIMIFCLTFVSSPRYIFFLYLGYDLAFCLFSVVCTQWPIW